jgi:uncharacterized membrane protein YdbT with pleckstrin-like domain
MGYVDENLISGENVAYRARLHWILFVNPGLIAIVVIAFAVLLFYAANLTDRVSTQTLVLVGIGVLVILAIPLLMAFVKWHTAEFAVTNKRVILKTGFVQSKTAEMFLNKIESVGVEQSIGGRIFGFGTIVIRGTGGSLEPFHRVSNPLRFRNQIQEQIGRSSESVRRPTIGN